MRVLLAGLVALVSSHSIAGELPQEIRDAVQKIGPVINALETAKLLAPLQRKEPYAGVAVTRDEKYGSDERHRLDVFRPNDAASALPVLLFVHGGAQSVAGCRRRHRGGFRLDARQHCAIWRRSRSDRPDGTFRRRHARVVPSSPSRDWRQKSGSRRGS